MDLLKKAICVLALSTSFLSGCETLKSSTPIVPVKEYEIMIVGMLDANYVGTTN